MSDPLKRTAFFEAHIRAGAKIVPFAGFEMPVQYRGVLEEHRCVRQAVGVFDVSHMGEFEVRGKDAAALVQRVTTNDVAKLSEGKVQYSAMCYDDGGIVDDLLVYHLGDHFMLVVNASNVGKDLAWIRQHAAGDVTVADVSDRVSLLAVQGPRSLATMQKLVPVDLTPLAYYHSVRTTVCGIEALVSRTGYTGELGYEIYLPSGSGVAETVWTGLLEAGAEFGIMPVGLGARDTLRLEMGFCLYGNDIDRTTNPLEAGLGWITKVGKGEFVGRSALAKAKESGVSRRLSGFVVDGKAFPRHGYTLKTPSGGIGTVTSGTFSPTLERGIGMGYVPAAEAVPGASLSVVIRGNEVPATIVGLPFVKGHNT
jgi:aminomethyltransferase